eukprot:COSAG06_NODE_23577_length_687_cov_2.585034_1_plen_163_part_00
MPARRLPSGDRADRRIRRDGKRLNLVESSQAARPHCWVPLPVGNKQRQFGQGVHPNCGVSHGAQVFIAFTTRARRHATWQRREPRHNLIAQLVLEGSRYSRTHQPVPTSLLSPTPDRPGSVWGGADSVVSSPPRGRRAQVLAGVHGRFACYPGCISVPWRTT